MNCHEFNERLYEYLDEALPTNVQLAAWEHVERCENCRRAVEREKVMAQSIERTLQVATARLLISPELRRRIVEAPEAKLVTHGILSLIWQWFGLKSSRFAGAAAALVVLLLLFVGLHNDRHPAANSSPVVVPNDSRAIYVVDVPFQTQSHLLQQHDGYVVDSIASSVAVGHAVFFEPNNN
jgi:hypothetical protein